MSELPKSDLMSVEELAEYLRMNPATVYRMACARKIPGFKVGRHWRFRKQSIQAWIERQELPQSSGESEAIYTSEVECCSLCGQDVNKALGRIFCCSRANCDALICDTCWTAKERRFCAIHLKEGSNQLTPNVQMKRRIGENLEPSKLTRSRRSTIL